MIAEIGAKLAQHGFDARFFIVSGDEQQQTRLGHALSIIRESRKSNRSQLDAGVGAAANIAPEW